MRSPRRCAAIAALALTCASLQLASQTAPTSAELKMQLPPDQTAFKVANAKVDPAERLAALIQFIKDFPKSTRVDWARHLVLGLLLQQSPKNTARIHAIAEEIIASAGTAGRSDIENGIAYRLAEASPDGADLSSAERWARDALKLSKESTFVKQRRESDMQYKRPVLTDSEYHAAWAEEQAAIAQTLADVLLREGKLADATKELDYAASMNAQDAAVLASRGEISHAEHHDETAVNELMDAAANGGLTPRTQLLLEQLYAAQHGGSADGLDSEIDRRYIAANPEPARIAHAPVNTGRTVLLELYTGAACEPCVAADLALDQVLQDYPRSEVVALSYEMHNAGPNPLANPTTLGRAESLKVEYTPEFRLDGDLAAENASGARAHASKAYQDVSVALDRALAQPSGVTLSLTAAPTSAHTVDAHATLSVTDPAVLRALLENKAAGTVLNAAPSTAPTVATPALPKLVMNFALVQPDVHYGGENGIRFHRMIVRDLSRATADGFPVSMEGATTDSVTFDPAAISASLHQYLTNYSRKTGRIVPTKFASTSTALPLDDLAVAAWVEDLSSHRVIAAAYAPLTPASADKVGQ